MNIEDKPLKEAKRCCGCGKTKSLKDYYRNRSKEDGRSSYCAVCELRYTKNYQKSNPQKFDKYEYYLRHIKRTYGISHEDYEGMIEKNGNKCDICGVPRAEKKRRLHIDHDHKTGQIRGILCFNCNRVLGVVKDDIKYLNNVIAYLKKFQKAPVPHRL